MARRSTLRVYYHEHLVAQAEQGRHNFTNRLRAAFESVGLDVKLCVNSQPARLLSAGLPGLALFHMDDPFHARALTLRLAYLAPFWRIEKPHKDGSLRWHRPCFAQKRLTLTWP